MSHDQLTTEEQLERAHETARAWRRAHDRQLQHTVAARAQTKAAERKARLLQSKLDGTAMAGETVMGGLCDDALKLLAEWLGAAELSHSENTFEIPWRVCCDLTSRTRALLSTPRVPK